MIPSFPSVAWLVGRSFKSGAGKLDSYRRTIIEVINQGKENGRRYEGRKEK